MDSEKTYNEVYRKELWRVFCEYEAEEYLIRGVKSLCDEWSPCVRWRREVVEYFGVKRGLREECAMSHLLFNAFFGGVVERWVRIRQQKRWWMEEIEGKILKQVLCADGSVDDRIKRWPIENCGGILRLSNRMNLKEQRANTEKVKDSGGVTRRGVEI